VKKIGNMRTFQYHASKAMDDISKFLGLGLSSYCETLSSCPRGIAQAAESLMETTDA